MNGWQAIDLVKERIIQAGTPGGVPMYKLIFCDYSMPEMDGVQVSRMIRKLLAQAKLSIPYICCCTAYNLEEFEQ